MSNKLKGSVTYGTFVWNSSEEACEKCKVLNGKKFKNIDEIPNKPHPNCKCWVDIVEDSEEKDLSDFALEFDEIISDAKSLKDEIEAGIRNFYEIVNRNYFAKIKKIAQISIDSLLQIKDAIEIFITNYQDMKKANTIGADKYFHSKANCTAAQRGKIASIIAKGISELREFSDSFKNVYFKNMTKIESEKDSMEDRQANDYGRNQGQIDKTTNCGVLVDKYRPNGLSEEY